ncbi:MAG: proline dehydrogenase family protein [Planctomycetota bacterium]
MSMLDQMAIASLPLVPRPIMRKLSARYIAGERVEDAIAKLEELRAAGFAGILDLLGEDVVDEAQAREVVATYRDAAELVAARKLDAYISVKPTHVGLRVSAELALALYDELARFLAGLGLFLRVEMEDHTTTDATLRMFESLRASHENVGIVLQSRLFRTPDDIAASPDGPLNVRMVKGIYLEPAEIAHVDPEPIRSAYVDAVDTLFARGAFVSLATHDEEVARRCFALCEKHGVGKDRYELQVLLGVRAPLWREWREAGHPVRVYVPYGPEWRAYSQRRLRKNPQIFRHVLKDMLGLNKS